MGWQHFGAVVVRFPRAVPGRASRRDTCRSRSWPPMRRLTSTSTVRRRGHVARDWRSIRLRVRGAQNRGEANDCNRRDW